jgi:multimeric flavodoxin WrbA
VNIIVFTASPNAEGLTASCGEMARQGALAGGAEVTVVCLNDYNIAACRACGAGWGECKANHECSNEDDFEKIHRSMDRAEGFVIISPVYWHEMSEVAKAFFDRLRRCEATKTEGSFLEGKPMICVAAAGGSGNGTLPCLESMERFINHVRGVKYDFISITRTSREYKLNTIKAATQSMASSLK